MHVDTNVCTIIIVPFSVPHCTLTHLVNLPDCILFEYSILGRALETNNTHEVLTHTSICGHLYLHFDIVFDPIHTTYNSTRPVFVHISLIVNHFRVLFNSGLQRQRQQQQYKIIFVIISCNYLFGKIKYLPRLASDASAHGIAHGQHHLQSLVFDALACGRCLHHFFEQYNWIGTFCIDFAKRANDALLYDRNLRDDKTGCFCSLSHNLWALVRWNVSYFVEKFIIR